jgi:hypothetical protein
MKYFLVIDYEAKTWFDQFRGPDFKTALKDTLENDPEMLGWSPDGFIEEGIQAIWDEEEKDWEFARGHFDKYVDLIYKSYTTREEIKIFDITDPLDVIDIKEKK